MGQSEHVMKIHTYKLRLEIEIPGGYMQDFIREFEDCFRYKGNQDGSVSNRTVEDGFVRGHKWFVTIVIWRNEEEKLLSFLKQFCDTREITLYRIAS